MIWFIIWIGLCAVVGVVASSRGRSGIGFFLLSIFLSPLLGLIIALVLKEDTKRVEEAAVKKGGMIKCPFCAELVKEEAIVCKHCRCNLAEAQEEVKKAKLEAKKAELEAAEEVKKAKRGAAARHGFLPEEWTQETRSVGADSCVLCGKVSPKEDMLRHEDGKRYVHEECLYT